MLGSLLVDVWSLIILVGVSVAHVALVVLVKILVAFVLRNVARRFSPLSL